jgi:hypothetical protein
MKTFNTYQFIAVIVPGACFLYLINFIAPQVSPISIDTDISLGSASIFTIISFVFGYLIQEVGHVIEHILWSKNGMPTEQILSGSESNRINASTRDLIIDKIKKDFPTLNANSGSTDASHSFESKCIYSFIAKHGRNSRIDIHNGTYGLFRGISACFMLLSIATLGILIFSNSNPHWATYLVFPCFLVLSLFQMNRYGWHYAEQLFSEYLNLEAQNE